MPDRPYIAPDTIHDTIVEIARTSSGKLTAVLTRIFGIHNVSMAEDVVQDVMAKAWETWQASGLPDNPEAWLFRAAKNRAIDMIRRNRRHEAFAADLTVLLSSEYTAAATIEERFNEREIKDDQLRMMFACCHPAIANEGQIAMILKILCGFSVAQIARAFITSPDTIEKRLYRAKQVFREQDIALEFPSPSELQNRLNIILQAIYLLFNEAHSASYHDSLIRHSLAAETIRLCTLLSDHEATSLPPVHALLALMYLHSSRLDARQNEQGELVLMKEQDRTLWDKDLIALGNYYLNKASVGATLSRYHLEAAIAFEHCSAATYEATNWQQILSYYDTLARLIPSPVVLLNRAVVIKELEGPQQALESIRTIPGIHFLQQYYLLHAILGELHRETGNNEAAREHYKLALKYVVSEAEKRLIQQKYEALS